MSGFGLTVIAWSIRIPSVADHAIFGATMTPSDLDEFIAANTGVAVRVDEGPSRVPYYVDGLPHHVETFTELVNRLTPYGVNATVELEVLARSYGKPQFLRASFHDRGTVGARHTEEGAHMSDELEKLLAQTPREISARDREEQRRSFAYGNAAIENKYVTREMVDRAAAAIDSEAAAARGKP